jgi:hypothetical protein
MSTKTFTKALLCSAVSLCIGAAAVSSAFAAPKNPYTPKKPLIKLPHLKPDLIVRGVKYKLNRVCKPNRPVFFAYVAVKNIGKVASPATLNKGVAGVLDSDGSGWGNGAGIPKLMPGQTYTAKVPVYYLKSNPAHMPGVHVFKVRLNTGKWIKESNYANNAYRPFKVLIPKNHCPPRKKPDITSYGGIQIGNQFAPWGGAISVTRKDASLVSHGRCAFRIKYKMKNQGPVQTNPLFKNRLRQNAGVVSIQSNQKLWPNQAKAITTSAYLKKGSSILSLSLDDDNVVSESNEGNNKFRVKLRVKCP